jgi:hypothetical protein
MRRPPPLVDGDARSARGVVVAEALERQLARALRRLSLFDQFANPLVEMQARVGCDIGLRLEAKDSGCGPGSARWSISICLSH